MIRFMTDELSTSLRTALYKILLAAFEIVLNFTSKEENFRVYRKKTAETRGTNGLTYTYKGSIVVLSIYDYFQRHVLTMSVRFAYLSSSYVHSVCWSVIPLARKDG